jgi:hypothetical protein
MSYSYSSQYGGGDVTNLLLGLAVAALIVSALVYFEIIPNPMTYLSSSSTVQSAAQQAADVAQQAADKAAETAKIAVEQVKDVVQSGGTPAQVQASVDAANAAAANANETQATANATQQVADHIATTSNAITYSKVPGNNYWDANSGGIYTCKNAPNVNLTGGNGDFANYCIFDKEQDVQNWCSSDSKCVGYVYDGGLYQALNSPPIPYGQRTNSTYMYKNKKSDFTFPDKFMLRNPNKNNLCVDDGGGSYAGQTQFHLWGCDKGNANQHFTYDPATQQIRNPNKNNLCVDDGGGSYAGQTKFHLWDCDKNNINQRFVYDPVNRMFRNPVKNNLCMDDGGGVVNGQTKFHLWNCDTSNTNQVFEVMNI